MATRSTWAEHAVGIVAVPRLDPGQAPGEAIAPGIAREQWPSPRCPWLSDERALSVRRGIAILVRTSCCRSGARRRSLGGRMQADGKIEGGPVIRACPDGGRRLVGDVRSVGFADAVQDGWRCRRAGHPSGGAKKGNAAV